MYVYLLCLHRHTGAELHRQPDDVRRVSGREHRVVWRHANDDRRPDAWPWQSNHTRSHTKLGFCSAHDVMADTAVMLHNLINGIYQSLTTSTTQYVLIQSNELTTVVFQKCPRVTGLTFSYEFINTQSLWVFDTQTHHSNTTADMSNVRELHYVTARPRQSCASLARTWTRQAFYYNSF